MAAAEDRPTRIEIGFDGGQVIAARMTPKQLQDLRKALGDPGGWHDLATEDGQVALDLSKVAFVRGEPSEHRVGFIG